jgi:hypothetical protein
MAENPTSEAILTTVASPELGLHAGRLEDLDASIAKLPRQQLALRVVTVLTGLDADKATGGRNVSLTLAKAVGAGHPLTETLKKDNSRFVEPLQQLVLLRRALTVGGAGQYDVQSAEGLLAYVDASRFASDLLGAALIVPDGTGSAGESALVAVASFLQRDSLMNPPHLTNWIARMRLMLNELPKDDERTKIWSDRLKQRIEFSFGLTFEDVSHVAAILSLWSYRFTKLEQVFSPDAGVALNLETWLSQTTLQKDRLVRFFERTALSLDVALSDEKMGGPISILPFRDRPFIQFEDGVVAPIHPALVIEKLTYDLFWWSGTPDKKQDHPWQRDWGDLVEAYVVKLLRWIADETGCGFRADIRWNTKQIDAAMWFKGHVALFEISAAMLTDAAAHSGDPTQLRESLTQILVRSKRKNGEEKNEAIAQVARDVKALLAGELREQIPVDAVTHVYPVVIAIDRRMRTSGLRFWFDEAFASEVNDLKDRQLVAPLAVWTLEDLETIEEMVKQKDHALKGTPKGALRLLRIWEMTREKLTKLGRRAGGWTHLVGHEIPAPNVNQRLKEESDRWWNEVKEIFKDAPGKITDSAPVDSLEG